MADWTQEWLRFLPRSGVGGFQSKFASAYAGESVCISGAGGYLGSAVAEALGQEQLRSIILLDSSEHGLFELQRHMRAVAPEAVCEYVLGSVDDPQLLNAVFSRFRPQTLFHAAAFKHVGLLENSPFAAVQNNTLGTYTLLQAALRHGLFRFVLVSTDKAVNPHSVMGVSKRIAELITLSLSRPAFRASAIRLANVIGSRGSVVPIFLSQIASGRAISVTSPHAFRYFLSRQGAVTAILAAGIARCDGMILIPELGAPVAIVDLADFLFKTQHAEGTAPIRFTGLGPGEKLREDLVGVNETRVTTVDGPLTVVRSERLPLPDCEAVVKWLSACIARRDQQALLQVLCQIVPEYLPSATMRGAAALLKASD